MLESKDVPQKPRAIICEHCGRYVLITPENTEIRESKPTIIVNQKNLADALILLVSKRTGISVEAIKGESRKHEITVVRHLAMWIVRQITSLSFPAMGEVFDKDHSTVVTACDKIQKRRALEPIYDAIVMQLLQEAFALRDAFAK